MSEKENKQFNPADLQIDLTHGQHGQATYKAKPIDITPVRLKMLACIHAGSPDLVPRTDILQTVWGKSHRGVDDGNLYRTRDAINETLEPHGIEIETVDNIGFRIRLIPQPAMEKEEGPTPAHIGRKKDIVQLFIHRHEDEIKEHLLHHVKTFLEVLTMAHKTVCCLVQSIDQLIGCRRLFFDQQSSHGIASLSCS
jgi:DNA-binding winged helix-turn-helix (wHTH) protein